MSTLQDITRCHIRNCSLYTGLCWLFLKSKSVRLKAPEQEKKQYWDTVKLNADSKGILNCAEIVSQIIDQDVSLMDLLLRQVFEISDFLMCHTLNETIYQY